jgi:hypothetical protein
MSTPPNRPHTVLLVVDVENAVVAEPGAGQRGMADRRGKAAAAAAFGSDR